MNNQHTGDGISFGNAAWTFEGNTTKTFSEHVKKSVPFYEVGHELVCKVSDYFITAKSQGPVYELGCSNADLLIKLAKHNQHKKNIIWTGIDFVPEMIETAKTSASGIAEFDFLVDDIVTVDYQPTDFMVAYYTIQFVSPRLRQEVLNKIYESLNWGGGFVMFEKVRSPDARFQDITTSIYTDYKLAQGYTPEEIVNKSRSLKGVLEPFSTQGNLDLLKRAGFQDITTILKYVQFEGFLAIK